MWSWICYIRDDLYLHIKLSLCCRFRKAAQCVSFQCDCWALRIWKCIQVDTMCEENVTYCSLQLRDGAGSLLWTICSAEPHDGDGWIVCRIFVKIIIFLNWTKKNTSQNTGYLSPHLYKTYNFRWGLQNSGQHRFLAVNLFL